MIASEIAAKFRLQVDDASELSTVEELDLMNDVYGDVCDDRDWEWLKTSLSGNTSTTVPYIALPADFKYIQPNKDNQSVVYVGVDFQPYTVVPFSVRREHRNQDGFCYIDVVNSRLVFTLQPTSVKAVEYDYIKIAPDLTANDAPLFRVGFHPILAFGMAARFNPLELSEKGTSYQKENTILYLEQLSAMGLEDAKIKLSI